MINFTQETEQKKSSGGPQNASLSASKFLLGQRTHVVVEEAIKALLSGFKETHDPKLEARNIKVELLCETFDTMMDVGQFFPKAHEIKTCLEKRGFKRAFFYVSHKKTEKPAMTFTVSFWDVDPKDPFTDTPYFEMLRTED